MKKCDVCWGVFQGEECPFKDGKEQSWADDYALMKKGQMHADEHQSNLARWILHGPSEHTDTVLEWAKMLMQKEN